MLASPLAAQSVPRADLPEGGTLRITFDPLISIWNQELHNGRDRPLGWFLTGNGAGTMPQLARLQTDMDVATGVPGQIVQLGGARLSLRAERRVTPLLLELGLSNRLSLGIRVPLVRVMTRADFTLDSTNANLGRNPRSPGGDAPYTAFFTQFDAAIAQMQQNITNGTYGPPGSGTRTAAQAFADSAGAVRGALFRAAYGAGTGDAAPFLPTATSALGAALTANVDRIQQLFAGTYGVAGFSDGYLLPTARASAADMRALLADPDVGFGTRVLLDTRRGLRYWLGDVEIGARLGVVRGAHYAATAGALVRLPTGHQDSPHDFVDQGAGDHQLDLEAELTQEATLGRLWLNAAVRIGLQQPGERERRLGPIDVVLVPRIAAARLSWDPGDYLVVDVAPMYRFTRQFGVGVTAGYYTQRADRYTYRSTQDSLDVAGALGVPVAAAVLNGGTAVRRGRVGGAVTFTGPRVEGALSVERVVSARGTAVPAETLFRLVMRTSFRLF